jgi:hypothetical protein
MLKIEEVSDSDPTYSITGLSKRELQFIENTLYRSSMTNTRLAYAFWAKLFDAVDDAVGSNREENLGED